MSLDDFEARLLHAGEVDGPDQDRKRAAKAALLGAVAGTAAAAGAAGSLATKGGAAKTVVGAAGKSGLGAATGVVAKGAALVKVLGVAGALVTAAAIAVVATRPTPGVMTRTASVDAVEAATRKVEAKADAKAKAKAKADATSEANGAPEATSEANANAAVTVTTGATANANANANATATPKTTTDASTEPSATDPLVAETRLLAEARACLLGRDLACAVARLAAYDARFPAGALRDEADVIGLDVARATGDLAGVRRRAGALLARSSAGPYAARARAALASSEETAGR